MPADTTVAAASVSTNFTVGLSRFLPHVESKEYQAADLRMDGNITGQVGYSLQAATPVWSGTWAGAAQVASVAAAAAVVALTF